MNSIVNSVILLQQHDKEAFRSIYEETYRDMYYLALKFMKNETDAQDVLQDSYIKVWNNIDSLKDPDLFQGWLSRIVANTAKNALAKNKPLLFSEMTKENDDGEIEEYEVMDENKSHQPELAFDEKETKEIVHQLIDSLSDEQRLCILMFHLQSMSISEIAETLSVSENTVKSRLNYGRKNIKKKVEELQSKGYKVYGFAPVWLLLLLLRKEKSSSDFVQKTLEEMQSMEKSIINRLTADNTKSIKINDNSSDRIVKETTASKAVNASDSISTKMILGMAAKKFYILICAAAIGIAAISAVVIIPNRIKENKKQQQAASLESDLEAQCQIIIDGLTYESSQYGNDENGNPQYTSGYYLYDMNGDGLCELLVMHMVNSGKYYVPNMTMYGFELLDGSFQLIEIFQDTSAYGYFIPESGNGLLYNRMSEHNNVSFWRLNYDYSFKDNSPSISKSSNCECAGTLGSDEVKTFVVRNPEIAWNPLSLPVTNVATNDFLLENIEIIGSNENTEEKDALSLWKEEEINAGKTIVQGTMHYVSYDELLKLQGKADPNPGSGKHNENYLVLVFDSPTLLNCQCGDGSGLKEKEANLIAITDFDGQALDGKEIIGAIDTSKYWWPSDTSLPLGEPTGSNIDIYSR